MKIFYQIIIVLFVLISFYLIRDEVKPVFENITSFLNKSSHNLINKFEDQKAVPLSSKVDMPGALKMVSDILNADKVKLTKDKIIEITNKNRKENGNLIALKENTRLDLSAEKKLQDMFAKQYFEHISPSGVGVGNLSEEEGYSYILIGENLAMGNFKDDQALVDAWMASSGHRANILNAHYTEIGVAVGKGNFDGKNVWMAVQHFGFPRSGCPSVDEVLSGSIELNQNKIKEMDSDLAKRRDLIKKRVVYEGTTYSEQVDKYNSLVNIYNDLVKDTEQKINNYNNQVVVFNNCLLSNQ